MSHTSQPLSASSRDESYVVPTDFSHTDITNQFSQLDDCLQMHSEEDRRMCDNPSPCSTIDNQSQPSTLPWKSTISDNVDLPQQESGSKTDHKQSKTTKTYSNHSAILLTAAHDLLKESRLTDVQLTCQGQTIMAHRLVLVAYSTYFYKQLAQSEATSSVLSLDHLNLDAECLRAVVEFMYTGTIPQSLSKDRFMTAVQCLAIPPSLINQDSENMAPKSANTSFITPETFESETSDPTYQRISPKDEAISESFKDNDRMTQVSTPNSISRPRRSKRSFPSIAFGNVKDSKSEFDDQPQSTRKHREANDNQDNCANLCQKAGLGNLVPENDQIKTRKTRNIKTNFSVTVEKKVCRNRKPLHLKKTRQVKASIMRCSDCDFVTKTRQGMLRHRTTKHTTTGPLECDQCGKTFRLKKHLKEHQQTHKEKSDLEISSQGCIKKTRCHSRGDKISAASLQCGDCGKTFQSLSKKEMHIAAVHLKQRPFTCDEPGCQYAAGDPSTLRQHKMSRHSEQKESILCEHCGRGFASRKSLTIHRQALHSTEAGLSCPHCSYSGNFRSALISHLKRMHGKDLTGNQVSPQFKCKLCKFSCFTKHEFSRHEMKHQGEKPHKCPICDFATAEKGTLKKHMRQHTGETPFACKDCSRKFTSQSGLARHLRSHTGVKPYTCNTCNKAYADKKSRDTHQYTHMNIKPYMCHMCTYSCIRKDILINHICKAHELDAEDLPAYLAHKRPVKPEVTDSQKNDINNYTATAADSQVLLDAGNSSHIVTPGCITQSIMETDEQAMFTGTLTSLLDSRGSIGLDPRSQALGTNMMSSTLTQGIESSGDFTTPLFIIQK